MTKIQVHTKPVRLPVLAMRGMVLFPQMVLHFDVGREKSVFALNEAMNENRMIFLSAQKDIRDEDPSGNDIYRVGVVAEVKQIIKSHAGLRVLVEGNYRARLVEMVQQDPCFFGIIEPYPTRAVQSRRPMIDALMRTVKDLFDEYSQFAPRVTKELVFNAMTTEDPAFLSEYIAANMHIHTDDKQSVLEESSIPQRLRMLAQILEEENEILSLENEIHEKVRSQIEGNQREYYLREQMKAISTELGEESVQEEAWDYHEKIEKLGLDKESAEKLHKEAERLVKMPPSSHEAAVIKAWLDSCLELPWQKFTADKIDIAKAEAQLDRKSTRLNSSH